MTYIQQMKDLSENREWEKLLKFAEDLVSSGTNQDIANFFISAANRNLGRFAEAIASADTGLSLSPTSQWGISLYYEACKADGRTEAGLDRLEEFLDAYPDSDQVRHLLVDQAAEARRFDVATSAFLNGRAAQKAQQNSQKALVVQCFAKPDTLKSAIERLLVCNEAAQWNLIIFQDGLDGNIMREKYEHFHHETSSVVSNYLSKLTARFSSVSLVSAKVNLGTTLGCRSALDFAFEANEYAVLLEDDCEFEESALSWFDYARALLDQRRWFIAGETIFFNPADRKISEAQRAKLIEIAKNNALGSQYTDISFVPSSCFATLKATWSRVRLIRGLPRGDENLSSYLSENDARTVMPMVPLVQDKGMLHEYGYSVAMLGRNNVAEIKSHLSVGINFDRSTAKAFLGDLGLMQRATCFLEEEAIRRLTQQSEESRRPS